jgi:hypothetical protein
LNISELCPLGGTLFFTPITLEKMADLAFKHEKKFSLTQRLFLLFLLALATKVSAQITPALPSDILINEFMPDPLPTIGLPNSEWVELYNKTNNKTFDLKNFQIINGASTTVLPSFLLKPQKFVVVFTKKSGVDFGAGVDTIQVAKLVTLSNPGDTFYLKSAENVVLDAAAYDLSFYQNSNKDDGGWSLERINPSAPCKTEGWVASENLRGGTPGLKNSVLRDSTDKSPLEIERYFLKNDKTLVVKFSKSLDRESARQPSLYKIENTDLKLDTILAVEPMFTLLQMSFKTSIKDKTRYKIVIQKNLADCSGNTLLKQDTLEFQKPEKPFTKDLIINELLVNPEVGGSRYLEIFNRSEKVIELAGLKIGNLKNSEVRTITSNFLLLPQKYVVVTEDPTYVQKRYSAVGLGRNFLKNKLPIFVDDEAVPILYVVEGSKTILLDSFLYTKELHNPLIANIEGVGLERVNPDISSLETSNWQSAASAVRYGTPARRNSQYLDKTAFQVNIKKVAEFFSLPSDRISPDDDGFEDFLILNYEIAETGWLGEINIYDVQGRLVKSLQKNTVLGTSGSFSWNGESDTNHKLPIGIYWVHIQLVRSNGQIHREKKLISLITRF